MWDGLFMLLFLSIIMGAASFFAGSLPLSFSLTPRQLRLMTALGTGVLVGTSLIVIIPEGVETLYSAGGTSHNHDITRSMLQSRENLYDSAKNSGPMVPISDMEDTPWMRTLLQARQDMPEQEFRTGPDDGFDGPAQDGAGSDTSNTGGETTHSDQSSSREFEPHVWIGISLILGFILMYLIDTVPQTTSSPSHPQRFHVSLGNLSFNRLSTIPENVDVPTEDPFATGMASDSSSRDSRPSSTTVGLVIHAAADGIALGASSTTSSSKLSFIIFIAIIIHKAPASFGLTTTLLKQGLSKRMARAHLIVFSLAAPVGALLTWSAVHLLGFSSDSLGENASAEFATGVLLLFSAGTFLYVAMHTMQENGGSGHPSGGHGMNGFAGVPLDDPYAAANPPSLPKKQERTLVDTTVTVGGMLLPLLTQWTHVH